MPDPEQFTAPSDAPSLISIADLSRALGAEEAVTRLRADGPKGLRAVPPVLAWRRAVTQLQDPAHGMFIGQHGSWNRKPRSGYNVAFVPFDGITPSGPSMDVLGSFLHDDQAYGPQVRVTLDNGGALLVADDMADTVWRVSAAGR